MEYREEDDGEEEGIEMERRGYRNGKKRIISINLHISHLMNIISHHQSKKIKANQNKSEQIRANQSKSKQIKANQSKSKQIKANQSKSNQIKPNQTNSQLTFLINTHCFH
jgi:hypothetical protein